MNKLGDKREEQVGSHGHTYTCVEERRRHAIYQSPIYRRERGREGGGREDRSEQRMKSQVSRTREEESIIDPVVRRAGGNSHSCVGSEKDQGEGRGKGKTHGTSYSSSIPRKEFCTTWNYCSMVLDAILDCFLLKGSKGGAGDKVFPMVERVSKSRQNLGSLTNHNNQMAKLLTL